MAWCLTKQAEQDLLDALKKDGDPQKMWDRGTEGRLEWFTARVGVENAHKLNALYERKMLLKNQIDGLKAFAKSLGGSKAVKNSMLDKIDRVTEVLDKKGIKQFMGDLVDQSLNLHVTEEEFKTLSDFNTKIKELGSKANENFEFPTVTDKFNFGFAKVQFENYVNDLKLRSKELSFRTDPVKKGVNVIQEVPGNIKSITASFDDSFWLNQGLYSLLDPKTSALWAKSYVNSFNTMQKELRGISAMDIIKADIYSMPNSLNGKFKAGGYGLDVLSEDAIAQNFFEKIPALRRVFKASEVAYNGGVLKLRADLANIYIKEAEKAGVNTLVRDEAKYIGDMISSMTGRGKLGKYENTAPLLNLVFWSARFMKANFDTLLAPFQYTLRKGASKIGMNGFANKGDEFARKKMSDRTFRIMAVAGTLITIAKILDPSTEIDPRSNKFGNIRVFGKNIPILGSLRGYINLLFTAIPTMHDGKIGFWTKNSKGEYKNLTEDVGYKGQTVVDYINSFFLNKTSPMASIVKGIWTGKNFQGEEVTPLQTIFSSLRPLNYDTYKNAIQDPNSPAWTILPTLLLAFSGLNMSESIVPNINSKVFKEDITYKEGDILNYVTTYAEALGTDPETAFNRIFTGQKIRKVTNGTIIVERMPLKDSTNIKKKSNANNPTMKLDHTIPLELGGSNDESNLKLVTTAEWSSYTKIENALGKALKEKKITKQEAQKLIVDFKNKKVTKEYILSKYK